MSTYSDTKFNLRSTKIGDIDVPMKTFDGIDFNFMPFVLDNMAEHLKYLKEEYTVRDDDVFICTYPRSGTNWTHEIVQMLLHGSSEFGPLFAFVENLPKDALEKRTSPRVLCTHLPPRLLPPKLCQQGKIIVVVRNPKDVAVSFHNFKKSLNFMNYNADWKDYLELFLDGNVPCGSWFDYVQDWERLEKNNKSLSILTLYFEDMKMNLEENVKKIAEFLGVKCESSLISEIASKCEFTCLNREKTTNIPAFVAKMSRNTPNFLYRKGQVGDWKNWFTVAQSEEFDVTYTERMKNSTLDFLDSTS